MDLNDFKNSLITLINEINNTREEESVIIAQELAATVRDRVQNDKEDAQGASFGTYSTAVVPQWYFYNRALSGGALDRIKAGAWFQSYEDARAANNLPIDAVNFTFSGDMFRQIGVTNIENVGFSTSVSYGGQTEYAKNILEYQAPKYGNIIQFSDEEKQTVLDAHRERIFNKLNLNL